MTDPRYTPPPRHWLAMADEKPAGEGRDSPLWRVGEETNAEWSAGTVRNGDPATAATIDSGEVKNDPVVAALDALRALGSANGGALVGEADGPFDANPRPLCPDPVLGTRSGWSWCPSCFSIQAPNHVHYREEVKE